MPVLQDVDGPKNDEDLKKENSLINEGNLKHPKN